MEAQQAQQSQPPAALTADEMDEMLNNEFAKYEVEKGFIAAESLGDLCAGLNTPVTAEEAQRAAGALDKDGVGKIELFEFKNWWLGRVVFGNDGEEQAKKRKKARAGDKRLLAAQLSRKQAEADAQLLANRIELLRQEEAKAWKKIQHTKIRAADILKLREEAERKQATRVEFALQETEHKRKAQHSRFLQKQRDRSNRQRAQAALVRKKQNDVREVRRTTRENEIEKQRQQQSEAERARYNREVVRAHERRLKAARRKKVADQKRANQLAYEARVREEQERTRAKESEVARMEREELQLIQRLQRAQVTQKSAYQQLEGALSGTLQ